MVEVEPGEHLRHARLRAVRVEAVGVVERGAVLGEQGVVIRGRGAGEGGAQALDAPQRGQRRAQGGVEHAAGRVVGRIFERLRQVAEARAGVLPDGAAVGLFEARHDAQQGGLAGAVRADQARAVARREREIDLVEDEGVAVALGDVGHAVHMRTLSHTSTAGPGRRSRRARI